MSKFKIGDRVKVKKPQTNCADPRFKPGNPKENVLATVVERPSWSNYCSKYDGHVAVKIDGDISNYATRDGWLYPPSNLELVAKKTPAKKYKKVDNYRVGDTVMVNKRNMRCWGANPTEGCSTIGKVTQVDGSVRIKFDGDVSKGADSDGTGWYYSPRVVYLVKRKKKSGKKPPRYIEISRNSTGQVRRVNVYNRGLTELSGKKSLVVKTIPKRVADYLDSKSVMSVKTFREIADKMGIKLQFRKCGCSQCSKK